MKRTLLISTLLGAIIGVGICVRLQSLHVTPQVQAASTYKSPLTSGCNDQTKSADIITLTNTERVKAGLPPLTENRLLNQAAQVKAQDMVTVHYWSHDSPTGVEPWAWFRQVGYSYVYAGENLAKDYLDSNSVVRGWMNSPGHRANILKTQYTEIGTAVVCGVTTGPESTLVVSEYGSR